jgi:hypothetical protein
MKYFLKGIGLASICFALFLTGGCSSGVSSKRFLFDHPEITLQKNGQGPIYNKYSSHNELAKLSANCSDEILTIFIASGEYKGDYEVLLDGSYQQIGQTPYYANRS